MPPLALFPRHRFIFCVSLGIGIKVGHTIVHPFEADDDKASLHHEKLVLLEDEGVELVAVDFVVFDVEVLLEKALPEYGDLLLDDVNGRGLHAGAFCRYHASRSCCV